MTDAERPFHEIDPAEEPRPLTAEQHEVYEFLRGYVDEHGYWPKYYDIRTHFGWKSTNSVTQRLKQLYSKGWIDRVDHGEFRFRVGLCPYCGSKLKQEQGSDQASTP